MNQREDRKRDMKRTETHEILQVLGLCMRPVDDLWDLHRCWVEGSEAAAVCMIYTRLLKVQDLLKG